MTERNQQVPFLDLLEQYRSIQPEIDAAFQAVVRESAFIGGPYLKAFEAEFAAFCGAKAAVGVSNGTDALRLALIACGVAPGDEVITVPNTFIATAEAISMVGAKARFVDIDPSTRTMDPRALEAAVTSRTRAVIPVHLYGQPADMDAIGAVCRSRGLKIVGDAAQAHGALYRGRKIAALADATCFSFYPGKNLGAYGDAGAVVTDDSEIAQRVRMFRDHGRTKKYEHDFEGFNCRMDGLQAAFLSVKLKRLDEWTRRRRDLAALYRRGLQQLPDLELPRDIAEDRAVYHLFVVQTPRRDELQDHLGKAGIGTGIHYPIPLHLQPAYAYLGLREGAFPIAEKQSRGALSLPLFPEMKDSQVEYVCREIRTCLQGTAAAAR